MQTPRISIYRLAAAVEPLIAGLLWHLSARRFRMASTCEELLDLFEETYSVREDIAPLTSSNPEDKVSKSGAAAVGDDFSDLGHLYRPLFRAIFV